MTERPLRVLVIGAHPDDCDRKAGGTAALYTQLGHTVKFVSVTNGESGHQATTGRALAERRRGEAAAAGRVLGIEYEVLDNRDGYLQPTVEARLGIIRLIRSFQPDLILTHRPNDYHPDHRYTSQLVCDAAYMVMVPALAPEVPALRTNPVIAYLVDGFQRPYAFSPTVVVDVEPVMDKMIDMLDCHVSQFYEWLPYVGLYAGPVPTDGAARKAYLKEKFCALIAGYADRHRESVIKTYGEERGRRVRYIEAYEPCEYGSPLTDGNRARLFPFLPQ